MRGMKSHTVLCVAAMALMTTLVACDKKAEGGAGSGTTTAAATGGKKAKTTRKSADIKKIWTTEIDAKMNDPMDKKVAAFLAKAGPPDSESGRHKIFMALDGDKCVKYDLDTKDGSFGDVTADKAECGM
jgi:hypothetical protein